MNKQELKIVRNHLDMIFGTWHACRLRKEQMYPEDYKRGLKAGMLCDDCSSMIDAHLQDIEAECAVTEWADTEVRLRQDEERLGIYKG